VKKLSLVLLFALAACGSGPSAAREEASPGRAEVQPASSEGGKFYREGLHGVDFSGLDAVARERALRIMNAEGCDCGCGMTIAQCRVEDKTCPRSPSLAAAVVNAIRTGASDEQALTALKALRDSGAARAASGPAPEAQAVAAVALAIDQSPFLGRADAAITLVTFEDFQ
jgi:hypothetical protein